MESQFFEFSTPKTTFCWKRSGRTAFLGLDYLIDVAEQVHGMLLVAQPVCRFDGRAGLRLDEGFEVQVYPDFALREGAEFVAIDEDEHHNQEDEPIEDRPLDN